MLHKFRNLRKKRHITRLNCVFARSRRWRKEVYTALKMVRVCKGRCFDGITGVYNDNSDTRKRRGGAVFA